MIPEVWSSLACYEENPGIPWSPWEWVQVLKPLRSLERRVIELRFIEGLEFSKISKITGYGVDNVIETYRRAIKKLRMSILELKLYQYPKGEL